MWSLSVVSIIDDAPRPKKTRRKPPASPPPYARPASSPPCGGATRSGGTRRVQPPTGARATRRPPRTCPGGAGAAAYASGYVRRRHTGWGVDESVLPRVGAHQPPGWVVEVGPDWLNLTVRGRWLSAWGVGRETWDGAEPGMMP